MVTTTMPPRGFFAGRLKQLRATAGLSQPALAEKAGLSVGTIRQFEQARREPSFDALCRVAEALGVQLSAFDPKVDPPPTNAGDDPEAPPRAPTGEE